MRSARWFLFLALFFGAAPLVVAPTPVYAEDDDDDDEFESSWIGVRLGFWWRPEIRMQADVSGVPDSGSVLNLVGGTDFDLERTLGVEQNVSSEYTPDFNKNALWEAQIFLEFDLVSLYVTVVPPYEYKGTKTLTETIEFGGETFTASTDVKSVFEQMFFSVDVTMNIFNNRYFKIAPLAGIRFLLLDWKVEAPNIPTGAIKADTKDIDSPFEWDDFQVFPAPELGADLRVGYRDYFEVGARISASYVNYLDITGGSYRAEIFVRFTPIPYIGIELGYRYLLYDISSKSDDVTDSFDFDLEFSGFTGGAFVRF